MQTPYLVRVETTPLTLADAYAFVSDPAHGAVDLFVGAVRNHHEGNVVQGITYDVHDQLAIQAFTAICQAAQQRWPEIKSYIAHYKGQLDIGGISVIIAVSSPHRAESFEACRFLIEALKQRAPIWKQEHYEDGPSEWLPGHSLQPTSDI